MNILDGVSPELARLAQSLNDKTPLLRAAAGIVQNWGERAFGSSGMRPAVWPNKKDGRPATLRGNPPVLMRSLKIGNPSNTAIAIGSDRPYSRAHQFGNPKGNLPARPYLPFDGGQMIPDAQADVREELERQLWRLSGYH